jgi:hypothetical protein
MNNGMDIIDQLIKKNATLEDLVKLLVKEVKVAEAKASSASNQGSTLKSTVDALLKRVTALEGKK